ncbi:MULTISPECIES: hypothetical protein [unclassified Moraxella]|uniref:hypothetical protein n=1 Tax=unclassified Moraxella TaxID=2685852 RepID=UPI003AF46C3F
MANSVVQVAGETLDFSILSRTEQLEVVNFFNFIKSKKPRKKAKAEVVRLNDAGEKILTLEELFNTMKGRLPADYKFDREEANAR